jgi:uncharacterized domain HDIG
MNITKDVKTPDTGFMQKISELEKILQIDPYTYKHSINVASYTTKFLRSHKYYSNEEIIYYSGLFHDIGKTQINQKILHKVSPLTEKEFTLIKTHVTIGHQILSKFNMNENILSSALFHHEQYGGLGYPYGIASTEIPLLARVTSICDVYDALTMDRPYRKAYPRQVAIEIMKNSPGQFDPELLPEFFDFLEREEASHYINSYTG